MRNWQKKGTKNYILSQLLDYSIKKSDNTDALCKQGTMTDKILYTQSAFKHGYTQDDIERAIETKIYEDTLKGEDEIYVIIGFDTIANPIEVFYNIIDDETIKVFHAMELRDKIAAQIEEEG